MEKNKNRFTVWASVITSLLANYPIIDIAFNHVMNHKDRHMRFHSELHEHHPHISFPDLFTQLTLSFLFVYVLVRLLSKHKWKQSGVWFLGWKPFLIVILSTVSFVVLLTGITTIWVPDVYGIIGSVVARATLIAIAAILLSNFIKIDVQRKKIFIENEELKIKNLNSQVELLRSQFNPHFFFNALNTLSYLIDTDRDKSQEFLTKLSFLLRSSLEMKNKDLIPLTRELELAETYIQLMKTRFGDNILYYSEIHHPERFLIPPMSLQQLVENTMKHNIISSEQPLTIRIEMLEDHKQIIVKNSYQPKNNLQSIGTGLQNLDERFRIIMGEPTEISIADGLFQVKLPLILVND
ncbi:MAG: histidine kinase [Bacteroidota bacterium]